ncbi:oxygen-insensitive NAD(P)H-dependent nitroreductase NfsB [Photobacterium phosphoreum]|uniref:oxygen-insensitive NAD(P)H-dependent nitroreductase NfsB n=1 Tax=Photobacterium phosphoreum TaxID=659 RepID=UPI0005D3D979|nr:oxygen-insensitive NAD(P)H-dependent nitroreductase NfsB [Photobacterium phosphoreum]KJF88367.1 dihydropteridine reductase [Photobacterium phosphoreum]MCD9481142.1 oxygen-insensitive NAD(P)H-dependent nitroreductase NfsB [Photobacterium phosphoreum]MCD9481827.1 oxygen-insensitive NAD(P)H-dependent nitroreductase NfsB [Photobacterium phosphoreum]PQJ86050.1 NAD(P)H nitroreductase [Photobacterium phosphoreum]PSU37642.1 oxygen-insensitive NAD(P)H-dependent nitroreductase NfsB [Photobacterium ph
MSIIDAAEKRYSTKVFDPSRKLNNEQLQQIKALIRLSASSVNSQPWHVIVAATDEAKQRIAKAAEGSYVFNKPKIVDASHVLVFCSKTTIDDDYLNDLLACEQQDGRFLNEQSKQRMLDGRNFFVDLHRKTLDDADHWMQKQVYLNIGSLLLGVAAMGIDAVPIEGFDRDILDKEFDLNKQGFTSLVVVPVGYHSADDFNADVPKSRWSDEKIFTEC